MLLKSLLKDIKFSCDYDINNIDVCDIVFDSRKIKKDCLFVCLKGSSFDGHKFYKEAIDKGACAIVAEDHLEIEDFPVIYVENTREALAYISCEFFGNPSKKLKLIGITGTKGKTTTSCMIKAILKEAGIKAGVIGTLGVVIDNDVIATNNTTPESYDIQKYLNLMVEKDCKVAVLEVSSIGLKANRVDGIEFDYGIFTNFSSDHIGGNEHKDLEEYLYCKSLLFKKCKTGILNIDDKNFENVLKDHTCEVVSFGFSKNADLYVNDFNLVYRKKFLGSNFSLGGKLNYNISLNIPGNFNIYNALSAILVCDYFNVSELNINKAFETLDVKGRIECVEVPGNYTLIIDYAHNAVSMENILNTLREYKPKRLITMFGAGGNRPKIRRYEMGEVSGRLSDLSVITEDNSRYEDVLDIIKDIEVGLKKSNGDYIVIPSRREAIEYCIRSARDGDFIVLAGKGHEDYQEIKGVKYKFDEREVISDILKKLS